MKKTIKALKVPALILFIVTSFLACDKDFYILESDVLGKENANFNTGVDSFPIISYNKKLDSLQINNLQSNLLGYFNDPEFGSTTASIITQIIPNTYNPDFGTNPTIDSVVLRIPYYSRVINIDDNGLTEYTISDSLYGNETADIKLSIYENKYFLRDLNPDNLGETQKYYSHASNGSTNNFARTDKNLINFDNFKGDLIKEEAFNPKSTAIETWTFNDTDPTITKLSPSYRAKLDETFWQNKIINKNGEAELSNLNEFTDYFRGLYFKAEPVNGDGNMLMLNFSSSDAIITIHYTKDDNINAGEKIQSTYSFNFNGNRLNTFINNFNTPFAKGNKELGNEELYLKGTEGSMAVVSLFDGTVDCDCDRNDDTPTETMSALDCFKKTYRKFDEDENPVINSTNGDFVLKNLLNEAHLVIYEGDINTGGDEDFHKYDRLYAYDIKNNIPTIDYNFDAISNAANPVNSKIFHLTQRDTVTKSYKIRLTEHLNNILLKDSTNTKIGLVLSTNVNITSNSEILKSEDDITNVPSVSVITPRGTKLHGSNENVPNKKRMKLKLFFTGPK